MKTNAIESPGRERLHGWWGLSYASYLVIPRSLLQSMPDDWQGRFAALLEEADEIVDAAGVRWPEEGQSISVNLRERDGRFIRDDLSDYQRGRRRLWSHKPPNERTDDERHD